MIAAHGVNIGHGYVKYIVIDQYGVELTPVVFPAQVGRALVAAEGSLRCAQTVAAGGASWWTGEDAQLAAAPLTLLAQARLRDPVMIPALVRGALNRFGSGLNGASLGVCVSGLPAAWAQDVEQARALGARLREGHEGYRSVRVIAEPLGVIYAQALDGQGQIAGDVTLTEGRIGVVDLGHHTVDLAIIHRLQPVPGSLETYQLGMARALAPIRAQLSTVADADLSIHQVDAAVTAEQLVIAGRARPLPAGWDRPLLAHAEAVARRVVEAWGSGSQLDAILIGGGGAAQPRIVAALTEAFAHAAPVDQPQTAIARGYARLARRLGGAS
jgi:hypothetical protein